MAKGDEVKRRCSEWQKKADKLEDDLTTNFGSDVGNEFAQLMADNPWCSLLFSARDFLGRVTVHLDEVVTAASQARDDAEQALADTQAAIDALGCETGGS